MYGIAVTYTESWTGGLKDKGGIANGKEKEEDN